VKLHIAVDVLGLPYATLVTTANISDIAGGIEMFSQPSFYTFTSVKTALCDGTYEGKNFADAIKELIDADVEIAKRSELHTFAVIPKRWIVERSFSWLDKCRRLWKNCERKIKNALNMVKLAFVRLLLRRY
jgi:transposase